MLSKLALVTALAAEGALAFPWVVNAPGVDSSMLPKTDHLPKRRAFQNGDCPFNPSYAPAVPISKKYPYLGAKNGLPGTGKGGIQVPAKGDTAHYFQPPGPRDIRGPCPGLNAAANHGFLARSGIVTFNELVDAQQNVYNVGWDLAVVLATAGVGLDGDILGTSRLSLGCDATARTAEPGNVLADELGLDGHNHFEADTSLTRDDYFLGDGDNYTWNATLFTMMMQACDGDCNLKTLSAYRAQRYQQSKDTNPHFFFGPGSLLLYGAASFLYELMPSADETGSGKPATMLSFFGAKETSPGVYAWNGGERIPPNWTNRLTPYTNALVSLQIDEMYTENPVMFGSNDGVGNFGGTNFTDLFSNGKLNATSANDYMCVIYQDLTGGFPSEIGGLIDIPVAVENAIAKKLGFFKKDFGCGHNFNSGS